MVTFPSGKIQWFGKFSLQRCCGIFLPILITPSVLQRQEKDKPARQEKDKNYCGWNSGYNLIFCQNNDQPRIYFHMYEYAQICCSLRLNDHLNNFSCFTFPSLCLKTHNVPPLLGLSGRKPFSTSDSCVQL